MPIRIEILDKLKNDDSNLAQLNLSRHSLNDEDIATLVVCLKGNTHLQLLCLCENDIGDKGATLLAQAIAQCPNLRFLDVSVNNIGDVGASALFSIKHLRHLDISANNISDLSAQKLLEHKSIVEIFMDGTQISPELSEKISAQIARNASSLFEQIREEAKTLPFAHKNMLVQELENVYRESSDGIRP